MTQTTAIRTVREDDDVHVIEGLIAFGGPFNGRDSYRTFASPRTNFYWDMFPDTVPTETGTRDAAEPRYIRPVNYQHGMDPDIGMDAARVGGFSPVRSFDQGVWVQAQLDKHNRYYGAIRELLGKDALAFSAESMEHAVRFDDRTGEWLEWPMVAVALTPTPANPWSFVASRSAGDIERVLRVVAEHAPASEPAPAPDLTVPAVRGGSWDAATAAGILQELFYLRGCEVGEADQVAMLDTAISSLQDFIRAESEEPDPDVDAPAYMSALRAGARNSASDQARIDAIHQHVTALGASAHQGEEAQGDDDSGDSEADAARSGGEVPAIRIVEPSDPGRGQQVLAQFAAEVAQAAVRSYRGDVA